MNRANVMSLCTELLKCHIMILKLLWQYVAALYKSIHFDILFPELSAFFFGVLFFSFLPRSSLYLYRCFFRYVCRNGHFTQFPFFQVLSGSGLGCWYINQCVVKDLPPYVRLYLFSHFVCQFFKNLYLYLSTHYWTINLVYLTCIHAPP